MSGGRAYSRSTSSRSCRASATRARREAARKLGGGLRPPSEPPPRNQIAPAKPALEPRCPSTRFFSDTRLGEIGKGVQRTLRDPQDGSSRLGINQAEIIAASRSAGVLDYALWRRCLAGSSSRIAERSTGPGSL